MKKSRHLTYANVVATMAAALAFGGTASLATGTTGASGSPSFGSTLGTVRVYSKKVALPSPTPLNYGGKFTVLCPSGQQAIAGGARGPLFLVGSSPSMSAYGTPPGEGEVPRGWTVHGSTPQLLIGASETVYVVCVD